MKKLTTMALAIYAGLAAFAVGLIVSGLNWWLFELWGGPFPGYQILLMPGNLTLIYVWHPLFTEEINFWPKLTLLLLGQFIVVTCVVAWFSLVIKWLRRMLGR